MTNGARTFENDDDAPEREGSGGEPVTDADLIQYLDGELDLAAAARVEAQIRAEPDLAARLEQLRGRSRRFSSLLTELIPTEAELAGSAGAIRPKIHPPPRTVSRIREYLPSPVLRAAAAIALLLGVTLGVLPARAWVLERVHEVAAVLGFSADDAAREPPELGSPVSAPSAVSVSFAVAADTFEVELVGAAGTLAVRREGQFGAADAPGLPGVRFVLLPNGLRIEAPEPVEATYRLTVPQAVRVLRVRTAGGVATHHALPPEGDELRVELGRR